MFGIFEEHVHSIPATQKKQIKANKEIMYLSKGYASAAGPFFIHWWQIGWRRGLSMHVFHGNLRFHV